MPYRTELRRPDLKGTFRCSLCNKIFCHSSSLSRHRMQAHFKSYTCTLCNKEITSNETLRAHMYKKHQISRMFMCRCCNWAFPDKTSLHIHMQAMATGNPGNVSIIAKSSSSPPPNGQTNNNNNAASISPSTASSIFPAMPSREELINRLRERAMIGGFAPPTGLDLSSLFPNFGKLSGSASSADGDGNNNTGPENVKHEMSDDDVEINCEEEEDDAAMADIEYGDSFECNTVEPAKTPTSCTESRRTALKRKMSSDSLGSKREKESSPFGAAKREEAFYNASASMSDFKLDVSAAATPFQMPILRSAISASPLNSLMYHKKLSNALRNKRIDQTSLGSFLNPNFPAPFMFHGGGDATGEVRHSSSHVQHRRTPSTTSINIAECSSEGTPPNSESHISPTDTASSNSSTHSGCVGAASTPPPATTPPEDHHAGGRGICFQCQVVKGKLAQSENRCRFLESRTTSQESKISRLENRVTTLESNNRRYETEAVSLRDHCENLERKILECQEHALKYLTNNRFDVETTKQILHDILETCRVYKQPC